MPTYTFKCKKCPNTEEVTAHVDSIPQTLHCNECEGWMRRVYTPPAIQFKGSGWGGK